MHWQIVYFSGQQVKYAVRDANALMHNSVQRFPFLNEELGFTCLSAWRLIVLTCRCEEGSLWQRAELLYRTTEAATITAIIITRITVAYTLYCCFWWWWWNYPAAFILRIVFQRCDAPRLINSPTTWLLNTEIYAELVHSEWKIVCTQAQRATNVSVDVSVSVKPHRSPVQTNLTGK